MNNIESVRWKWMGICLLMLCVSAYVSVTLPISEKGIPFSAQSLAVFVIAGVLSTRETAIVIGTYLLIGVLGMPVFAEGSSGISKIMGPSGGFLVGFLISGCYISWGISRHHTATRITWTMLVATMILFFFGLSRLLYQFGWQKALEYGLYPFWIMALVKAGLAAMTVYLMYQRTGPRLKHS